MALVVVLLVAVLLFAVRVARAEQSSAAKAVAGSTPAGVVGRSLPSPFAGTGPSGGAGSAGGTGSASSTGGPGVAGTAPKSVKVHVAGQVAGPGVVSVAEGARVVDAIALAGGPLPGADVQHVNLARVVVDGEQVYVPTPGEAAPAVGGPAGAAGAAAASAGGGAGRTTGALTDLNSADMAALDGLPGVGPVLARRIVDWRTEHGRFTSVDELGEVSGIGEKLLAQIRPKVRV